jgi:hypothetical protein
MSFHEGKPMGYQVVAAILTVALWSTKSRTTSRGVAVDQWRNVWRDYNKFMKQLEKTDESIDRRGINPD